MTGNHWARKSTFRIGHWFPAESEALQAWLHDFKMRADARGASRHSVIEEFAEIRSAPTILRPISRTSHIDQSVKAGARVAKGDELGFFQYGGSTVCCLFRPGAIDAFALGAIPELDQAHPPLLRVNSFLARAGD